MTKSPLRTQSYSTENFIQDDQKHFTSKYDSIHRTL